ATQPLAVKQLGAREFHAEASAAKAVDRLAVEDLGVLASGDERTRAGLDAECPVGTAGASHLREPVQGIGRSFGHPHPGGCLDELGYRPVGNQLRLGVLTCLVRGGQSLLVAAKAVAQDR